MMKYWKYMKKKEEPKVNKVEYSKPPNVLVLNCTEEAEEHIANLEEYILTLEKEIDILKSEVKSAKDRSKVYNLYTANYPGTYYVPAWTDVQISVDESSVSGTTVQPPLWVNR